MLQGLRILVTQADVFMGPALCEALASHGAEVLADTDRFTDPSAAQALIHRHGHVDVLLVNLAVPAPSTPAADVADEEWHRMFDAMVHPLQSLVKAVLPQMLARGRGKVLVMGSASALRGMKRSSSYSAARGAQLAYVQAVGVELAPLGIQVNAIAQNFVDNPTYFPAQVQADQRFIDRLKRDVPLGRLVKPQEDAEFAAYLCSSHADCFVGQVFPLSGGWAVR